MCFEAASSVCHLMCRSPARQLGQRREMRKRCLCLWRFVKTNAAAEREPSPALTVDKQTTNQRKSHKGAEKMSSRHSWQRGCCVQFTQVISQGFLRSSIKKSQGLCQGSVHLCAQWKYIFLRLRRADKHCHCHSAIQSLRGGLHVI